MSRGYKEVREVRFFVGTGMLQSDDDSFVGEKTLEAFQQRAFPGCPGGESFSGLGEGNQTSEVRCQRSAGVLKGESRS